MSLMHLSVLKKITSACLKSGWVYVSSIRMRDSIKTVSALKMTWHPRQKPRLWPYLKRMVIILWYAMRAIHLPYFSSLLLFYLPHWLFIRTWTCLRSIVINHQVRATIAFPHDKISIEWVSAFLIFTEPLSRSLIWLPLHIVTMQTMYK